MVNHNVLGTKHEGDSRVLCLIKLRSYLSNDQILSN